MSSWRRQHGQFSVNKHSDEMQLQRISDAERRTDGCARDAETAGFLTATRQQTSDTFNSYMLKTLLCK